MPASERLLYRYWAGRPWIAAAGWGGMALTSMIGMGTAHMSGVAVGYALIGVVAVILGFRSVVMATVAVYPSGIVVHTVFRDHRLPWAAVRGFSTATRRSMSLAAQHVLRVDRSDGSTLVVAGFFSLVRPDGQDDVQAVVDLLNQHRHELMGDPIIVEPSD